MKHSEDIHDFRGLHGSMQGYICWLYYRKSVITAITGYILIEE